MAEPGGQKKGQSRNIKMWAMEKENNVDDASKNLVGGWLRFDSFFLGLCSCSTEWSCGDCPANLQNIMVKSTPHSLCTVTSSQKSTLAISELAEHV